MYKEKVQMFIDALREAGYEPKSYSGRGMYGTSCVSIHGGDDKRLTAWGVAKELWYGVDVAYVLDIPEPQQGQLGLGIVLYWPSYEWPKDEED